MMFRGISISSGIARGEAFVLSSVDQILVPRRSVAADEVDAELARIRKTGDFSAFFPRLTKHGEKNCSENRQNGDHDEQLDQCKCSLRAHESRDGF